jgi:iron complex outermembrane recepter protein
MYQDTRGDGSNDVNRATNGYVGPPLGDLQQNYIPGVGGYDRKVQAYSATLTALLGIFDVTSLTGYNLNKVSDSVDYTYALGPYTESGVPGTGFNGFGVPGTPLNTTIDNRKYTQEFRLGTKLGNLDLLIGAFYTHETAVENQSLLAEDPVTGAIRGQFANFWNPTKYSEYAGFTDLTYHFTDRFSVQVGGRESEIKQSATEIDSGPYVPALEGFPSPLDYPDLHAKASAFTYLVTPEFKFSEDLMLYARLASGYRAGGVNLTPGSVIVPREYGPDRTRNHELGLKGEFLDHRLVFDGSVYYIQWSDIQLNLLDPENEFTYNANGGRAKSEGVELSMQVHPLEGLALAAWVSYNDAALTETLPTSSTATGFAGSRLPNSSRFDGNLSLNYEFSLSSDVTVTSGVTVSYVGDRYGPFGSIYNANPTQREFYPFYVKTDVHVGTRYKEWTANLFVNNLADRRGVLGGGIGSYPPFAYAYLQPRTIGISLERRF